MATGANDAQGIWQYGEDDSNATFSALLNRLGTSTSTQFGVDRGRLTTLEARSLSGLVPIVPSSVSISGGTATTSTSGAVTFGAGTTQVTLNGVFTSAFKNYRIVFFGTKNAVAANDFVILQLTASGTAAATNYNQAAVAFAMSNAASQNLGGTGGTGFSGARIYQASTPFSASYDIFQPQVATKTTLSGISYGTTLGDEQQVLSSGIHQTASSYDGLKLIPTGNAMSGQVAVYGIKD